MSNTYHLAQLNIARLVAPIDDPVVKEFVDNLDKINALGERAPGYVWRLQSDEGNATDIQAFDDPRMILNLTVWEDVESLKAYTYKTEHVDFVRRRRAWFEPMAQPHLVLWWVLAGHLPTADEAKARLAHLREHGESAMAFTFRKPFPPPNQPSDA